MVLIPLLLTYPQWSATILPQTPSLQKPLCWGKRGGHAVVAVEGKYLYAVGGDNGSGYFKTCEKYSLEEDKWTSMASLSIARYALGAATMKGYIHAMGGLGGDYKEVEREFTFKKLNGRVLLL